MKQERLNFIIYIRNVRSLKVPVVFKLLGVFWLLTIHSTKSSQEYVTPTYSRKDLDFSNVYWILNIGYIE